MKVSGFSYVRNGFQYDYPFLEAIQSVLPVCDEFIMVVGDSTDGTREAIEALNDARIRIVDTIWDDKMRQGGHIFAQQANIGLDHCTGDWCFHIQADEVIHEKDLPEIKKAMEFYYDDKSVDGFLFHFLNFIGDYKHYGPSRRFHDKEIRIVRKDASVRSYRDSQGFRKFANPEKQWEEKGEKLRVKLLDATVYHYSYVKHPKVQASKQVEFGKRWHADDNMLEAQAIRTSQTGFNYSEKVDVLAEYNGSHPAVMKSRIDAMNWKFEFDPKAATMSLKERVLYAIQKTTGKKLFTYRNYKIV